MNIHKYRFEKNNKKLKTPMSKTKVYILKDMWLEIILDVDVIKINKSDDECTQCFFHNNDDHECPSVNDGSELYCESGENIFKKLDKKDVYLY